MALHEPIHRAATVGIMSHIDTATDTIGKYILRMLGMTGAVRTIEESKRGLLTIKPDSVTYVCPDADVYVNEMVHADLIPLSKRHLLIAYGPIRVIDAGMPVTSLSEGDGAFACPAIDDGLIQICFVDNVDRANVGIERLMTKIGSLLSGHVVPLFVPGCVNGTLVGLTDVIERQLIAYTDDKTRDSYLVEQIPDRLRAESTAHRNRLLLGLRRTDARLFTRSLLKQESTIEGIKAALRHRVTSPLKAVDGSAGPVLGLVPAICGSLAQNKGIRQLLDAIDDYVPKPPARKRGSPLSAPVRLQRLKDELEGIPRESLAARAIAAIWRSVSGWFESSSRSSLVPDWLARAACPMLPPEALDRFWSASIAALALDWRHGRGNRLGVLRMYQELLCVTRSDLVSRPVLSLFCAYVRRRYCADMRGDGRASAHRLDELTMLLASSYSGSNRWLARDGVPRNGLLLAIVHQALCWAIRATQTEDLLDPHSRTGTRRAILLALLRELGIALRVTDLHDLDGCLVTTAERSAIHVNQRLSSSRQDFVALHELAHFMLGHRALSEFGFAAERIDSSEVLEEFAWQEREADGFASLWSHVLTGLAAHLWNGRPLRDVSKSSRISVGSEGQEPSDDGRELASAGLLRPT